MSNIINFNGLSPSIHSSVFTSNAIISGNVTIKQYANIWYNCVIRGDVAKIEIGENTNIQDGTIVHVSRPNHIANKTGADGGPTTIGKNVTIGHQCIIHAATIEDECFVGMGSILLDMARMEKNSMLAAGSLLTPGKTVKTGELWAGRPAKFMRNLTQEELDFMEISAQNYIKLAQEYIK